MQLSYNRGQKYLVPSFVLLKPNFKLQEKRARSVNELGYVIEMYSSQAPKIVDDIIAQLNSNESNRIIIGLTSLSEMIKKEPRYGKLLSIY